MSSLQQSDDLAARGAPSPSTRVSLADLEAKIAAELYVDVDAIVDANGPGVELVQYRTGDRAKSCMTLCMITTVTGFVLVGKSAPADPVNFDPEKGRTFAREDAIRQLWPLEGYLLRDRLHAARP